MAIDFFSSNIAKLISNYIGRIWNLLATFIFIPIYISYLGIESYAIIGLYAVVLGIISFADAGMSSAMTKEFSQSYDVNYKYNLFRNIEKKYWLVIAVIVFVITTLSELIATHGVRSDNITIVDFQNFVILIGIGCAVQLVSTLYSGALFGLGKQVEGNFFQMIWTANKTAVVIVLFELYSASLYVFFVWQIICNIAYVFFLRYYLIKTLSNIAKLDKYNQNIPTHLWEYIGGMVLIAVISSINTQVDKVIIGAFYSLKVFGYYSIVSTLAQIPTLLAIPLAAFAFPLLSKYATNTEYNNKLTDVFKKFSQLLYMLIIVAVVMLFIYPQEILQIWIRQPIEPELIDDLIMLIRCLSIGSLFLAMQFPFYYLLLAKSKTNYTVKQGVGQLLIGVPLLFIVTQFYGFSWVGVPWLLINLLGLIYLMNVCFNSYISYNFVAFLIKNMLVPLVISVLIGMLGYGLYQYLGWHFLLFSVGAVLCTFFVNVIIQNIYYDRPLLSISSFFDFPRG